MRFSTQSSRFLLIFVRGLSASLTFLCAEEEERAARLFSRRPEGRFHCLLCFDDFSSPADGVLLHCGHATCQDCFKQFAGVAIQNTDILRCPSCAEPVASAEIASFCDAAIATRYAGYWEASRVCSSLKIVHLLRYEEIETILLRRAVDFFHCPTRDCPNSVVLEDRTQPLEFRCDSCAVSYCSRCSAPWHAGQQTCLQREQSRAAMRRISISSSDSDSSSSSAPASAAGSDSVVRLATLPI